MTRIRFDSETALNVPNINELNNVVISSTEPTTGEEVWIQRSNNLFDDNSIKTLYALTKNGNEFSFNGTQPYGELEYEYAFEIGKPYTFSFNITQISSRLNHFVFFFYKDNTYEQQLITTGEIGNYSITITPTKEVNYATLRFFGGSTSQRMGRVTDIQIEKGVEATSYEPYVGKNIYIKNADGSYETFLSVE